MPAEAMGRKVALLFTADEVAAKVESLAADIAAQVADPLTMIVVLKGAFMFGADLVRALSRCGRHPRIEFMRLASYGGAMTSSGAVRLRGEAPAAVEGRGVLLVDDVLDTGLTLSEAQRLLRAWGAAEVHTCVLVRKEGKQTVPVHVDFVGFTVGDVFVVGYGIDYAEQFRDLPYLGAVNAEA